jgi:hypothetical protein
MLLLAHDLGVGTYCRFETKQRLTQRTPRINREVRSFVAESDIEILLLANRL